jgi:thiamine pyrophosphate-dependent acetolactate synthase large subunit-like protein
MVQKEYISNLLRENKDAVIIGSLGTISKDLEDFPNAIKVKGAMGCVMGIGLGYALSSKKNVIVIIGDGSYLMKAGSVNTILNYKLDNLRVIILKNNKYASTGGHKIKFNENIVPNDMQYHTSWAHKVFEVVVVI